MKRKPMATRIEPADVRFRNGWDSRLGEQFVDMLTVAAASALMILGMFYGLSELVIRGWIG